MLCLVGLMTTENTKWALSPSLLDRFRSNLGSGQLCTSFLLSCLGGAKIFMELIICCSFSFHTKIVWNFYAKQIDKSRWTFTSERQNGRKIVQSCAEPKSERNRSNRLGDRAHQSCALLNLRGKSILVFSLLHSWIHGPQYGRSPIPILEFMLSVCLAFWLLWFLFTPNDVRTKILFVRPEALWTGTGDAAPGHANDGGRRPGSSQRSENVYVIYSFIKYIWNPRGILEERWLKVLRMRNWEHKPNIVRCKVSKK